MGASFGKARATRGTVRTLANHWVRTIDAFWARRGAQAPCPTQQGGIAVATLTREEFRRLLMVGIERAVANAQREVKEPLPDAQCLDPSWRRPDDAYWALDDIVDTLYVDGHFPRVTDLAVSGVWEDCTIIWIRPSGHAHTRDLAETWDRPPGMGPFCVSDGVMLPVFIFDRPRPRSLADLRDAAWFTREQRLGRNPPIDR